MRHIVHVFTVPESLGFLRGQAAYLRERGYRLTCIASDGPGLHTFARTESVDVAAVAMPRKMSPGRDAKSLAELVSVLRRLRPDIVHSHTPKGGLLGTMAATAARVPRRIYHMRGLPMMTARGAQRVILSTTERISCALASRVLAVSHSLRDVAIAEHLCRRDKIQVLAGGSGNGVDADRFAREHVGPDAREALRTELGIPADARVVGFVGRLVKDKGISELATAFRALRAQSPNVHLIVAGPFEERDPVPPETRLWLKQEPHVHLLGRVDDTPKLYAAMDVLALPTYREGFPNVPLEAAAMRVPVVATRVAGCVDAVVDGVTGSLVPARDAESLEKALRRYLDDSTLCEAHGANGRARVELSFRRERIWEALAGVYDELMAS